MFWPTLLAHAFNPVILLLLIHLLRRRRESASTTAYLPALGGLGAAFVIYLSWLVLHWLGAALAGNSFDLELFIGSGRSWPYFAPFALGLGMIFVESVLSPLLTSSMQRRAGDSVLAIMAVVGGYLMAINYLHWIRH